MLRINREHRDYAAVLPEHRDITLDRFARGEMDLWHHGAPYTASPCAGAVSPFDGSRGQGDAQRCQGGRVSACNDTKSALPSIDGGSPAFF